MGYHSSSYRPQLIDPRRFINALNNDVELARLVEDIVITGEMRYLVSERETTKTAYRRIHEHIASTIDRAIEKLRTMEEELKTRRPSVSEIGDILLNLSRGLVLVEYQRERNQIGENLANVVSTLLKELRNQLSNIEKRTDQQGLEELRKILERARVIIDSIIVLAEKYPPEKYAE